MRYTRDVIVPDSGFREMETVDSLTVLERRPARVPNPRSDEGAIPRVTSWRYEEDVAPGLAIMSTHVSGARIVGVYQGDNRLFSSEENRHGAQALVGFLVTLGEALRLALCVRAQATALTWDAAHGP